MRTLYKDFVLVVVAVTLLAMMIASFIGFPVQAQVPVFDKSNFHDPLKIDNKYLPFKPGKIMIYNGTDEEGKPDRDVITVTNITKEIQGIPTRVVNDTEWVSGKLVETTNDWYAQDDKGNVWYMGEDTTDFTNKKNPHEGSWQAGVKGAKGGTIMLAEPKVGVTYDQEIAKGVAEDKATVLSLDNNLTVPYGSFSHVLKTKEFSSLEPDVSENKYYAANVGDLKEKTKGSKEGIELVQIK
ncbi:MAG TPA: hypothetical protein VE089_03670 [Nitrososphaeraceae archaeon]|jgi:hypothetical protein|nr:hypothetical protein [Nitrososphaeraceae archaeon]